MTKYRFNSLFLRLLESSQKKGQDVANNMGTEQIQGPASNFWWLPSNYRAWRANSQSCEQFQYYKGNKFIV